MKINKPAEEVEICDFCRREIGILQTCPVCRKQYCLTCEGCVAGSWGFLDICRECSDREDVVAIALKYADQITPIIKERQTELENMEDGK